jgi:outer membrane protein assembly factor BamE (lipoprotein component of BamABCDE complex)
MYKLTKSKIIAIALFAVIKLSSCTTLKGYQMVYQNDSQMQASALTVEKLESEGVMFREGASGGDGGHTGGGCGCN